ncbi:SusE domain-containing protein [Flavitalea sp. BT771]|uniref:SusE domain-containing protein n=1 Tax=Flavitalea sp. BT771 TaxID=3063329 RepID=UPI0026E16C25|nr:SusE domain-containing protein [Flavitalea sp. BT771]MDO6429266.1 SusE domain-containing protein [Flavitalea sp. BT771]MDV6218606.1 SusE domain-containing protein [Flavitalea sp. BT771]
MNYKLFLPLVLALMLGACKKDTRSIDLNVTAVATLYTPVDNQYIKLDPKNNPSQTFQWEQARAEDGSLVLYEVAFDQTGGDFSKPFYTVVSDGKGIQNTLTLAHSDLNRIAALGGADFYDRKKFIWTVFSSKGTNRVKAKESRTIDLERPAGFNNPPTALYITGTATETGDDITKALQMKRLPDGVFEIYTKLSAGTYQFVDGLTGTARKFYLADDHGIVPDGSNTFTGASKIVRIRINFDQINSSMIEVKSIQLWYCDGNTFWFTLPYTSNGVWRYNGYKVVLDAVPWGREERYKYKMVINDGTGDKDQWLNYSAGDSPGQDGQYPHALAYKTINFDANNSSQYDWSWKFDKTYLPDNTITDFWISLRATDPAYTENYQKE